MRILIVEDDSIVRMSFVSHLKEFYEIYDCENASEARDYLNMIKFDLIITDINMPKINGFGTGSDLIEYVNKNHLHIPIIIVTAYSDIVEIYKNETCIEAIRKPIDFREFHSIIEKVYNNFLTKCKKCTIIKCEESISYTNSKVDELLRLINGTK